MMLTWRDVAGGLPEPEVPTPTEGWATRFFETPLMLKSRGERQALDRLARKLGEQDAVLALRDANGVCTPCRLIRMAGEARVVLEFAVVSSAPA
ncbi:hypothetical protein [Pedomonas mirosovicensis]|uniref:hypothetical protein n=1 Tax=Pedomonas mirosovicensis TaxID=2908641 RepID=UPI00216847F7|nr:hypothetical protein [Pedomonas mirosovicensis]MCH8685580.1 hypothetical protein [Pedomonas mirosovicensis]